MELFSRNNQQTTLDALISVVNPRLVTAGFEQTDKGEWTRRTNWKVEEVDLRIRHAMSKGFQPAFRVALPRSSVSPVGDTYRYIAEEKLSRILDPNAAASATIEIATPISCAGDLVTKIANDISKALQWFDQFASPGLFKQNLERYLKPGCPAHVDATHLLDSLISK